MKGKRHSPEQIVLKLQEAGTKSQHDKQRPS